MARHARGQAIAEFALAVPVFLLMVFGLLDIGRVVYVNNAIAQGAREAARWGSVQGRSGTAAGLTSIAAYARSSMAAVPNPTVTVTCTDGVGNAVATCRSNDILVIRVTSSVGMFTPLIGQLVGTVVASTTSQVVVNQ
jgi:Flp pilus assembly protein TadG